MKQQTLMVLTPRTQAARPLLIVPLVMLLGSSLAVAAVHALFDLATPAGGPFPNDQFTVADASHNTGHRVSLPLPDCTVRPSDCQDLNVINTLDGFNVQPRLSVPFDGPIDVNSVDSGTVFLLSLGSTLPGGDRGGRIVGVNQIVWDPPTNTLHAQSDELLDQHTRYALIVTNKVRDLSGARVKASEAFEQFRQIAGADYKHALLDALQEARRAGARDDDIVTASVFTTQSVTADLEKIRDQIKAATPAPADFRLGPGGTRTVFPLSNVTGIKWNPQKTVAPPPYPAVAVDIAPLQIIPGAVGALAFGKYNSPDYEVHPGEFIPATGTLTGTPAVQSVSEVFFNLFLPAGAPPAGGWPVAIFGHGSGANKNDTNGPVYVAAKMAEHGIATITINVVGSGFGPLGTLTVSLLGGGSVTFSAGGRGIDQNHDNVIAVGEGRGAAPPWTVIGSRDGQRQTVVDLMQLVREIEVGMDVDGDGVPDLNPSRIYYFGHSIGGLYGTCFLAVEPHVRAGVPNVPGAPPNYLTLTTQFRPGVGASLASRIPSLINTPGLTQIGGVTVGMPYFNENLPLRDQPPLINTVTGAMEIQELLDNRSWVYESGNAAACAPHLWKDPLLGVPAKPVIVQIAKGDQFAPNPMTTEILRAGDLAGRATFYRNDLAYAENPAVAKNPHFFMLNISVPAVTAIARGAQEQIAVFFASDGQLIIHPEPARFFETPIVPPLPEGLNFIP